MDIERLIEHCRSYGIEFCLGEGTVRIRGITEIVQEMLPVLRAHKHEIIEYLIAEQTRHAVMFQTDPFDELDDLYTASALVQTRSLLERVMEKRI